MAEPYERFARAFAAVCLATNHEPDPMQITVFWRALDHIPADLLEEAAGELARDEDYFPTVAKWVKACSAIAERRARLVRSNPLELTGHVDRGYGYEVVCPECEDKGWRFFDAETHLPLAPEDVPSDHGRRYVKACLCRGTNPVWRRNHPLAPDFARPARRGQRR